MMPDRLDNHIGGPSKAGHLLEALPILVVEIVAELLAYRLANYSDIAYCSFGVRYSVVDKQIMLTNMGFGLVNSYFDFHIIGWSFHPSY